MHVARVALIARSLRTRVTSAPPLLAFTSGLREALPPAIRAASSSAKAAAPKASKLKAAKDKAAKPEAAKAKTAKVKAAKMPREKKRKDPNKPKRAQSAFMFFSGALRESVRQANPEYKLADVSKELGRQWRELTEEEKAPYQAQADADKERYSDEMTDYVPQVYEDDDDAGTVKRKRRKKDKDPNRPKKNMTAFFFYSGDFRGEVKQENPDFRVADIGKELGRRWREMSDEDKAPYQEKAEEDKERYQAAMAQYNEDTEA